MKKQTGFTLIEIMIALLLGLIVVGATITIYITTIRGSSDIAKSARLNHDLDSALALMVNDIRRAGYWGGSINNAPYCSNPVKTPPGYCDNPFTKPTTDLYISPDFSCILYTYDANASGANTLSDATNDVDVDEYYGFRLNGGNIQMRSSNIACTANGWNTLNVSDGNEQIDITNLIFTQSFKCLRKRVGLDPVTGKNYVDKNYDIPDTSTCAAAATAAGDPLVPGDRVIETREITIRLAGRVNNDQAVTKNITDSVKIRNDRVFTQPSP